MKRTADTSGRGNNGDWYLEVVGGSRSQAGPPTRFEELQPAVAAGPASATRTGAVPAPDTASSVMPAAAPGSDIPTVESTTELVGKLWDATGRQDPLEGWSPEELSRTIQSQRNFRWTVIGAVIVAAVVGWVLIAWLPSLAQSRADARAAEYRLALTDLRAVLPGSQTALALVTDPSPVDTDLGTIIEALTDLDAAAQHATRVAATPLPSAVPLLSRAPIDALEPSRDETGIIGADAEALAGRISDAFSYRTLYPSILDLPPLPTQANADRANELSVELAALLADSVGVRAELPSTDPAFAQHLAGTDDAIERFGTWQVDYIEALRASETATAEQLVAEMRGLRDVLDVELLETLAEFRSAADAELLRLADEIDAAVAAIPG